MVLRGLDSLRRRIRKVLIVMFGRVDNGVGCAASDLGSNLGEGDFTVNIYYMLFLYPSGVIIFTSLGCLSLFLRHRYDEKL